MVDSQKPFFVSPRTAKSLWQEYRIYEDRVELECKVALQTLVIPASEILEIEVRPPLVFADILRGKSFVYSFALKIDFADLYPHVAIKRESGVMKNIRFTPEDPDEFVAACKIIMD